MKHSALKILKWTLVILSLPLALSVAYVVQTIWQIPIERLESTSISASSENSELNGIELESGSLVARIELLTYLRFAETGHLKAADWIRGTLERDELSKASSSYIINKNVNLPPLSKNNCEIIYCYQHRVPFENIPSVFWKGLIGIEDYRFLEHSGIDPKSIARAILTDIKNMSLVQGGSTLTQQLVKNLFYSNEKSFTRKIKEIIVSVYIEYKFSKENILEAYFNEVMWGSLQGIKIKGIYSASLFYFDKKPNEITPFEASILIGLLKGPYYYSPFTHMERLQKRADTVFNKLSELNLYPDKNTSKWSEKKWKKWKENLELKNNTRPYFAVWRALKNETNFLNDFEKFVFMNKSVVLDQNLKEKYEGKDITIKVLMGDVRDNKRFSYYSKYERKKADAIQNERHQIGSTLKPVIYSLITSTGLSLDEEISMEPISLDLKSGTWTPKEAHKNVPERVTLREALLHSYNRPVIRLSQQIGFEAIEKKLLHFLPNIKRPLAEYPAQLLGAVELSLDEIFNLYKKFVFEECLRPEEKNILLVLSDPTTTTVRNVVGSKMREMKFFGKTGTSNNGLDNWYVSFDGATLGVIYVGYEGNRSDASFELYGSSTAFRIYQDFVRDRGRRFNELSCDFANPPATTEVNL